MGDFDLSSLRRLTYGSAPMDAAWIRRTIEAFPGVELIHSYGLTETSPILTTLGWEQHLAGLEGGERLRSVGRPLVGVELRITDDDGNDVPAGEAGEVAVRAPNVSPGYLDRPEETAAVFRGGWFYTGDVGRLDAEGYLYLFDRKKDVIITGGENVWSTEVEAALYAHPEVVEAAVIGVPDETWGEALLAVVVPAPDSELDAGNGAEILMAHCRERIGGYKVPRRYRFVDALPEERDGKDPQGRPSRAQYRDGCPGLIPNAFRVRVIPMTPSVGKQARVTDSPGKRRDMKDTLAAGHCRDEAPRHRPGAHHRLHGGGAPRLFHSVDAAGHRAHLPGRDPRAPRRRRGHRGGAGRARAPRGDPPRFVGGGLGPGDRGRGTARRSGGRGSRTSSARRSGARSTGASWSRSSASGSASSALPNGSARAAVTAAD